MPIGIVLIIVAALLGFLGMTMDTTVPVESSRLWGRDVDEPDRVFNLGLMAEATTFTWVRGRR